MHPTIKIEIQMDFNLIFAHKIMCRFRVTAAVAVVERRKLPLAAAAAAAFLFMDTQSEACQRSNPYYLCLAVAVTK